MGAPIKYAPRRHSIGEQNVIPFPSGSGDAARRTGGTSYDKVDRIEQAIKSHIDKRFEEYLPQQESKPKHVVGISRRQKARLWSMFLASGLSGVALSLACVSLLLPGFPPVFFFLSLLFPLLGVAISCGMAVSEGSRYDQET
jgi:hypothetical protein